MKKWAWCLALGLASGVANGETLDQVDNLGQAAFKGLAQDLAGALGYKAVAPAEPLGLIGFDVGIELTATSTEYGDQWAGAMSDSGAVDTLVLPKLYVQKGLPFGIDVGAYYVKVPSSNIEAWGGELKYAVLEGSTVTPAVAVRGSFSGLFGVDQLDFETRAIDVSISKGFLMFTPYAGIGRQWTTATPKAEAADAGLVEESFSDTKMFVGLRFTLGVLNISAEQESVGDVSSANVKLGIVF